MPIFTRCAYLIVSIQQPQFFATSNTRLGSSHAGLRLADDTDTAAATFQARYTQSHAHYLFLYATIGRKFVHYTSTPRWKAGLGQSRRDTSYISHQDKATGLPKLSMLNVHANLVHYKVLP